MITVLMWVALVCYFVCLIPQIITNYRLKSGTGVSEFMLLGYLNAYLFMMFYIFGMQLPLAYLVMAPAALGATLVLIIQRLYYDQAAPKHLHILYASNIAFFACCLPFAFQHPLEVGMAFGWCNFILSVVNQLPQIAKIHKARSVVGFSFMFVVFNGIAAVCETIAAFAAHLPLPTCVNAVRAFVLFLIFCWQFYRYRA